jgi:hypothetical protein
MPQAQAQIADLWKVTSGIREDVSEIRVTVARMEERGIVLSAQVADNRTSIDHLQRKVYIWIGATVMLGYVLQTATQLLVP